MVLKKLTTYLVRILKAVFTKKSCCKTIALLLIVQYGYAQTLSFQQISDSIRVNNPMLKMYDAQSTAYTDYAEGAKSWMPPQVGAGFFMTPYNTNMWKGDNMGNKGMGSLMLQAEQMIPNPKTLESEKKYMQSMGNQEIANRDISLNAILYQAKASYYQWQTLIKKRTIVEQNISLLNYLKQSVEIHYKYGTQSANTIYKTDAMIAEDSAMLIMIDGMIDEKKVMLNTLMKRKVDVTFTIDTLKMPDAIAFQTPDTLALKSNLSSFKLFNAQANTLKLKQNVEQNKLKPEFGIQYAHMFAFGNQPQLYTLMGMMKLPIVPWSDKMSKANVKGINSELEAIEWQKQNLLLEKTGTLQTIIVQITAKHKQINSYHKSIIPALVKNYKTALIAFEQNTGDLLSVQDALMSWKAAQLQEVELYDELLQLHAQYERETEKY